MLRSGRSQEHRLQSERRLLPETITPRCERDDMTERTESDERIAATLRNEPIARIPPNDPTEPSEKAEPTDPIDRKDLCDAMHSVESVEAILQRERDIVLSSRPPLSAGLDWPVHLRGSFTASVSVWGCDNDRVLRVLLLADTHLGFDLPHRPRVERRRRGPDFFANYERALEPARRGEVDLVVHGGDVLFRSKVRGELVQRAFSPLMEVAAGGVPVVVVPGNHERSAIPFPLLAAHPDVHLLDHPRTIGLELGGEHVAVSGFPFQRERLESRFSELVEETDWREHRGAIRLLCLHQTVEGAQVGPVGYTFRRGHDIVRGRDIPSGFAAVLAGHIHRRQVLTHDLAGRQLAAPVLYPGSIERTSAAERDEPKGYMTLDLQPTPEGGRLAEHRFHELPARPMVDLKIRVDGQDREHLRRRLERAFESIDADAVVRLELQGDPEPDARDVLSAPRLRSIAPTTMTLTLRRPEASAQDVGTRGGSEAL